LNPKRLLFAKPFKNKQIAIRIEDLKERLKLETEEGRSYRLQYIKDMLKSYEKGPERYPSIERDLKQGIIELMKPANPQSIKELLNKVKRLESKL